MHEVRLKIEDKEPLEDVSIQSATDVIGLMQSMLGDMDCEYFVAVHVNANNEPMNFHIVSSGGFNSASVDPKALFATALLQSTSKIILIHNHPSGSVEPSSKDIEFTKKLIADAALLDMQILDHIIVSDREFFSFASNNLIQITNEEYMREMNALIRKHDHSIRSENNRSGRILKKMNLMLI